MIKADSSPSRGLEQAMDQATKEILKNIEKHLGALAILNLISSEEFKKLKDCSAVSKVTKKVSLIADFYGNEGWLTEEEKDAKSLKSAEIMSRM